MKKICAVLLIVIQVLTISVFADSRNLSAEQIEDLQRLGIMNGDESGDLRLGDNITRAEVAKMICVAGNVSLPVDSGEKNFDDVDVKHWAHKYISAVKQMGVANGDSEGKFNPESNITNEETVKMIVCLLGYKEMAEQKSGYPAGYMAVATQIGITKDMGLAPNTAAKRSDVAAMISNALDTPIMAVKSDGGDDATVYVVLDGKNGNPYSAIRGTRGKTWDTSVGNINKLALEFASRYPYKDGDTEKSFELYPNITYSSGMEKTESGVEYECPAIYDDNLAYDLVKQIQIVPAKLKAGNVQYEIECAKFNSKILVPYDTFKLLGCETTFDNDSVLEIMPNIIGMRKNKAEGYWVPLEACARFIDDTLYVPLDAAAKEFGINADEILTIS